MFTLKRHIFDTFRMCIDADDCIAVDVTVAAIASGYVVVVVIAFAFYRVRLNFFSSLIFCSLYHDRFEKAMNSKNFFSFLMLFEYNIHVCMCVRV